jgi:beta-glucosidase
MKKLRKFERVTLEKGENKTISFKLNQQDFSYWDETKKDWTLEAGTYEIMIGTSSADIKLMASVSAIN